MLGAQTAEGMHYSHEYRDIPRKMVDPQNLVAVFILGTIKACPCSAVHASNHAQYVVNWKYGIA